MKRFTYGPSKLREISFPLGGIGTGCIGLAGDGRLIDWEVFNRPNKNSLNGFSHFAVRAESRGKVVDSRVLHGDLQGPYSGGGSEGFGGFGFGPSRGYLAGLPHFKETIFEGEYPLAAVRFNDRRFPGRVALRAFNPFIPLNDKDSGIPAALFEFELRNTTRKPVNYTIAGTLGNPLPAQQIHRFHQKGSTSLLHLTTDGVPDTDPQYGDLSIATDASRASCQQYWFNEGHAWFDALEVYWRDLNTPGPLREREYASRDTGKNNQGTLAAHVTLRPGQKKCVRFVISWNFPVFEKYWGAAAAECCGDAPIPPRWRNYYSTIWQNSTESAVYSLKNWDRLYCETRSFHDALFLSTLPEEVLDAVSANISILKTPTVLRLEDGTFYGFEGCHSTGGCCEGTCTHVWNYAQALPFLFPALERGLREVDYKYNQQANGGMPFRLQLPLGSEQQNLRSCADGLFGNVMMVYRDWKIAGDTEWLRKLWPSVKKSIEFAWDPTNEDQWDPERTGVLWGRQHHTLDMELFGPSSWLCGLYLGALKAAAEMAEGLGDGETSADYLKLFERGKAWVDEHLFNGEYYHQNVDIKDRSVLERHDAASTYWDAEHGEMKYQIDEGCSIDQVLAQYHARLYGLGEIFDPRKLRKALRAIFRHNFVKSMRDVYNPCRLYSLNDESGLVICSWPEGRRKPAIPVTYAQETMHGFEYAAAVQMIQNGMLKQGLAVVKGVRDRYDGEKRNPWNEFECGSNYARSMASYALLNAFSGFEFDMVHGMIGFKPVRFRNNRFRSFWSLGSAWGEVEISPRECVVRVLYGSLKLNSLALDLKTKCGGIAAALSGRRVACKRKSGVIVFNRRITIKKGQSLKVKVSNV